jgi:hypothetical protein
MVVFLLCAVPLLGLLYLFSFYGQSMETREVLRPGAAGIIIMAVVLLLLYIFNTNVDFDFTRRGIFLREWSYGFALPYVLVFLGLVLLRGKVLAGEPDVPERYGYRSYDASLYGQLCSFWFGAGTVIALFHSLYAFGSYTVYNLFLYPVLLFFFCCISAYVSAAFFGRERWSRYVFAVGGLLIAALAALVPFFYYINYHITAYAVFAAELSAGLLYLYLLNIKKVLPRP